MPVRFQEIQKAGFRFFITEQGDLLMGVDLFDALGGTMTLGRVRLCAHCAALAVSMTM